MRNLSNDFITALESNKINPVVFFSCEFGASTYHFTNARNDIIWDGKTFLGNGYLVGIPDSVETSEAGSGTMSVVLMGQPLDLISLALNNLKHDQIGELYLALLDDDRNVIDDPHMIFRGNLDDVQIQDGADTATITLIYQTVLSILNRASNLRYNQRTQQIYYPTDIGFEYMEKLTDWTGYWGKVKTEAKKKSRKGSK